MLGFIFDTILLEDENHDFYGVNVNYTLFEKHYLPIFKNIIVATRCRKIKKDDLKKKTYSGYKKTNGDEVTTEPITAYNKVTDAIVKRRRVSKQLTSVIEKCDFVIIRLPSPLGDLACNICRKMGKPYMIELVACPWDGYRNHGHPAGKLIAPFMFLSTRNQCKRAERVLYVTQTFLQRRYPTNGTSVGVSDAMIPKQQNTILEHRFRHIDFGSKHYKLGLVGNLNLKYKGHETAIKALKLLSKKYPEISIDFVGIGDNSRLEKLRRKYGLAPSKVNYLGSLPGGETMFEWMDSLDILLIPSLQEGLPRTLVEAMSRGCPVVGAKTGGIPELIGADYIHEPKDYKKLAELVDDILQNKSLAKNIARTNFEKSKEYTEPILDEKRSKFLMDFYAGGHHD